MKMPTRWRPRSQVCVTSNQEVAALAEELTQCVTMLEPGELWIPMGLGEHVDHRSTRSACLLMLAEARGQFSQMPVCMYEDIRFDGNRATLLTAALHSVNTRLTRGREDITDVFREKLRLVSVYASQFKLSYIEPILRQVEERETGVAGTFAEAVHYVEGELKLTVESRLRPEAPALSGPNCAS
jgi:LmbE family N-acetylglucosaminyl deacetylase